MMMMMMMMMTEKRERTVGLAVLGIPPGDNSVVLAAHVPAAGEHMVLLVFVVVVVMMGRAHGENVGDDKFHIAVVAVLLTDTCSLYWVLGAVVVAGVLGGIEVARSH